MESTYPSNMCGCPSGHLYDYREEKEPGKCPVCGDYFDDVEPTEVVTPERIETMRPTIGNTVAVDRFNPNGPAGYVRIFPDGARGPLCATREEAEQSFRVMNYRTGEYDYYPLPYQRLIDAAIESDPGESGEYQ